MVFRPKGSGHRDDRKGHNPGPSISVFAGLSARLPLVESLRDRVGHFPDFIGKGQPGVKQNTGIWKAFFSDRDGVGGKIHWFLRASATGSGTQKPDNLTVPISST